MALDPNTALCTSDDVARQLGKPAGCFTPDQLSLVESFITTYSKLITDWLSRGPLGYDEEAVDDVKLFGWSVFSLPRTPVYEIGSMEWRFSEVVVATDSVYIESEGGGIIGWRAPFGFPGPVGFPSTSPLWSNTAGTDRLVDAEGSMLRVTYEGGFWMPLMEGTRPSYVQPLPSPISYACARAVAVDAMNNGINPEASSVQILSAQTTFGVTRLATRFGGSGGVPQGLGALPLDAMSMLLPYKRTTHA